MFGSLGIARLVRHGEAVPRHAFGVFGQRILKYCDDMRKELDLERSNPNIDPSSLLKEIPTCEIVMMIGNSLANYHFRDRPRPDEQVYFSYLTAEVFTDRTMYDANRFYPEDEALGVLNRAMHMMYESVKAQNANYHEAAPSDNGPGGLPRGNYDIEKFRHANRVPYSAANVLTAKFTYTIEEIVRMSMAMSLGSTNFERNERDRNWALTLSHFVISICKRGTVTGRFLTKRFRDIAVDLGHATDAFDGNKEAIGIIWNCYASKAMLFKGLTATGTNGITSGTEGIPQRFFERLHAGLDLAGLVRLKVIIAQARFAGFAVVNIIQDAIKEFPDFYWNAIRTGSVTMPRPAGPELTRLINEYEAQHEGVKLTPEEIKTRFTVVQNNHILITQLSTEFHDFLDVWNAIRADSYASYRPQFAGKSKLFSSLGYLAKQLLIRGIAAEALNDYGGLDRASDARIINKIYIDRMISAYIDKKAERMDVIPDEYEENKGRPGLYNELFQTADMNFETDPDKLGEVDVEETTAASGTNQTATIATVANATVLANSRHT